MLGPEFSHALLAKQKKMKVRYSVCYLASYCHYSELRRRTVVFFGQLINPRLLIEALGGLNVEELHKVLICREEA